MLRGAAGVEPRTGRRLGGPEGEAGAGADGDDPHPRLDQAPRQQQALAEVRQAAELPGLLRPGIVRVESVALADVVRLLRQIERPPRLGAGDQPVRLGVVGVEVGDRRGPVERALEARQQVPPALDPPRREPRRSPNTRPSASPATWQYRDPRRSGHWLAHGI